MQQISTDAPEGLLSSVKSGFFAVFDGCTVKSCFGKVQGGPTQTCPKSRGTGRAPRHRVENFRERSESGAGILPASRAQAGKMPAPLSKVGQASCLPPSPKQARCLLHFPPFLPGNTLKIQPPLSPNQTSRKFQEVLSDPAVGELKRRVECTQSAPAKAKGWREKRAHPVKGAKSLNLLLLRIPFRRTATPPQESQTPLRDRIALHGLERGGGIEVRLRRSGCRSSSRLGSADKACLGRRPRRPRRLSLV